jgi:ABC-type bacteriocin/lantibiotic exporter with double-glycine peptidase domain
VNLRAVISGTAQPISQAFKVLPKSAQKKLWLASIVQVLLNLLDLVGVALLGAIGALSVAGVSGRTSPGVERMLQTLGLGEYSFIVQISILGIVASSLFVIKAVASIAILRRINAFLSNQAGLITGRLIEDLLHRPLSYLNSNSIQSNLYSTTIGIEKMLIGILGSALGVLSDGVLLVLLSVMIAIVDPLLALTTIFFFGGVIAYLYLTLNKKARNLGKLQAELSINNNQLIISALSTYRENLVGDRTKFYANLIGKQTRQVSLNAAELTFMPNISKYILETSIVVGSLIVSAIQFSLYDSIKAVGILSIYLAASSRIVPAMLRLQQGFLSIQSSSSAAGPTLALISNLSTDEAFIKFDTISIEEFDPSIVIQNLSMRYKDDSPFVLKNVNLKINAGQVIGILGDSGSGKSTLIDLLLGVEEPTIGHVTISGVSPREAFQRWPGQIGYVPQEVFIFEGTLRENVCLGYEYSHFADEEVLTALALAQLSFPGMAISELLKMKISDRGSNLSGGQRQRIGIARAMITNPKLLVLDEPTSALDSITEAEVISGLLGLRGKCTILFISHKKAIFEHTDQIIEIENGGVDMR